MSLNLQDIAAWSLVALAAVYVCRHVWRAAHGKESCGTSCDGCPANSGDGELVQIEPAKDRPAE